MANQKLKQAGRNLSNVGVILMAISFIALIGIFVVPSMKGESGIIIISLLGLVIPTTVAFLIYQAGQLIIEAAENLQPSQELTEEEKKKPKKILTEEEQKNIVRNNYFTFFVIMIFIVLLMLIVRLIR